MSASKPITVIGGGLAGLGLGLLLRRDKVPVDIYEAGRYPRHRVCGEFISGRGIEVLRDLGLEKAILEAGGCYVQTVKMYTKSRASSLNRLPAPALSISRYALDALLADHLHQSGANLVLNHRCRSDFLEPGVVCATGRKAEPVADGWRWFALKVHWRGLQLEAQLEMHLRRDGYVGISRLRDGTANVCGLFRRRVDLPEDTRPDWRNILKGPEGSRLHRLLSTGEIVEGSFCAVAGLGLRPKRASETGPLRIGDALTMIPPVTGNGMSIAFESAQLAAGPLAAYSAGRMTWEGTVRSCASLFNSAFQRRLYWAQWIQKLLVSPLVPEPLIHALVRSETLWDFCVTRTR